AFALARQAPAHRDRPTATRPAQAPPAPVSSTDTKRTDRPVANTSTRRPRGPYVVEPPDVLRVEVLDALPGRPITGEHVVRPDGTNSLGFYWDLEVTGLTLAQIKEKLILHLRTCLTDEALGLQVPSDPNDPLSKLVPVQPPDLKRPLPDDEAWKRAI